MINDILGKHVDVRVEQESGDGIDKTFTRPFHGSKDEDHEQVNARYLFYSMSILLSSVANYQIDHGTNSTGSTISWSNFPRMVPSP
ncbi:hypothetical protein BDD12DRAFT_820891 [Trichophaea hybrida]|nr:hypothetical protein BDD12DRAFT_820891 [Trichophaea hybrida]